MQPPCCQLFSDALGQVQMRSPQRRLGSLQKSGCIAKRQLSSSRHRHNFVDQLTGVHTQEAESAWSQLKLGQKRRKGLMTKDLQSYLDERMWQQWRAGDINVSMRNFLAILPLQYRTDTPVLWGSPCGYDICCSRFVYCKRKKYS